MSTEIGKKIFPVINHHSDVCVIGGGMSGLCAAFACARRGAKTILIHDRPVFGGNASSEVRMHICGAQERFTRGAGWNWENLRETGIIEELRLANQRHNPQLSWHVWDGILYDKARCEPNLEFFLNCSCLDAVKEGDQVKSILAWQTTTQSYHSVEAAIFLDCSGDSVLAPLVGSECRYGREGRDEFGESRAPEAPDNKTMGMTLMFSAVDTGKPHEFIPPSWAKKITHENIPFRKHDFIQWGYAWIELGGEQDMVHDTDAVRDELLSYLYGVWDHIKNGDDHGAQNWALDWVQFLPGKRESRRLIGDYIMTQNDIETGGQFPDVVAYGGWPMDAHAVEGIRFQGPHTQFYYTPSPYGIPYRCLYSRNIENLMFAGRNISASHMALTSTRVIATCAIIGQAVGTAAALAITHDCSPRQVGQDHLNVLQQQLIEDDCYLPGVRMEIPLITQKGILTASAGDPEPLRNGINRPVGENENAWWWQAGDWVEYEWDEPIDLEHLNLICDSDLNAIIRMNVWEPPIKGLPPSMVRDLRVDLFLDGKWKALMNIKDNEQRLIRIPVGQQVKGIRVHLDKSWGSQQNRLFSFTAHGKFLKI
jgi:hypothetical protein